MSLLCNAAGLQGHRAAFIPTAERVSDFIQQTELPATHPLEQRLKKLQCATRDAQPVYDFDIVQRLDGSGKAIRRAVEARRKLPR